MSGEVVRRRRRIRTPPAVPMAMRASIGLASFALVLAVLVIAFVAVTGCGASVEAAPCEPAGCVGIEDWNLYLECNAVRCGWPERTPGAAPTPRPPADLEAYLRAALDAGECAVRVPGSGAAAP